MPEKKPEDRGRNLWFGWLALWVFSFVFGAWTAGGGDLPGVIGATLGVMFTSLILTSIPWLYYRIRKDPLTRVQFQNTFAVSWLVIVIFNFLART